MILLRAPSGVANLFERELTKLEIPVFSESSEDYLESLEIQRVISLLKVIDNPYQDIPLLTVLRSPMYDFSDIEITKIRLVNRDVYFYNSLEQALESSEIEENLKNKIRHFIDNINTWRCEEKYLSLNELIWKIYMDTGYYSYIGLTKNGDLKRANLKLLFEKAKDYEKVNFKGLFNFIKYLEKIRVSNKDFGSAKIIGENEDVVRIMSIHKSKGLEFPVVFLSRSDKQINLRDLNDDILINHELGIGPKYINYERKIKYDTASRKALKARSKIETISEEMRVLYVALTRAKEKLIITGIKNDYEKDIQKKKDLIGIYEKENGKINHLLVQKYISFLDWIELVYLNNIENIKNILDLKVISKDDIKQEEIEEKIENKLTFDDNKDLSKVDKILNWKYERKVDTLLPSNSSVTKIKQIKKLEEKEKISDSSLEKLEYNLEKNDNVLELKPEFMKDKKITAAQRGTIMHLCMQKLDFRKNYSIEELNSFIEKLQFDKFITEEEKKTIDVNKIKRFLDSNLASRIRNSKALEKEKPFYSYIKAKDIYNLESDENIVVQGVIDLYFIEKNGNIVLVDYKTDYTENEENLKNEYKVQLDIYKSALENTLNVRIDEVYIYSIFLDKEIKIM